MTTLTQQIEEMRLRIKEVAHDEHGLVRALGDALSRADQKLLHDVRHVTIEHEVRRGAILKELEVLASRIGMFLQPREPLAAVEKALRHFSSSGRRQQQVHDDGRQAVREDPDHWLTGHTVAN